MQIKSRKQIIFIYFREWKELTMEQSKYLIQVHKFYQILDFITETVPFPVLTETVPFPVLTETVLFSVLTEIVPFPVFSRFLFVFKVKHFKYNHMIQSVNVATQFKLKKIDD